MRTLCPHINMLCVERGRQRDGGGQPYIYSLGLGFSACSPPWFPTGSWACLLLLLEVLLLRSGALDPALWLGSLGIFKSPPTRTGVTPHMSLGPPLLDSPGSRWSGVDLPIKTGYSLRTGIFPTGAFSTQYASPC